MKEQHVQSLDRTLDIIELLATSSHGMGVTQIANCLNLHKSTVHRLLSSLSRRGYIEKDVYTGFYKIGLKFVEISSLFLHQLELKTEASPMMRRLAEQTGQVVHLAILDTNEIVYIEKTDIVQSLRLYSQIGKRIPVYCSALGKVLLSGQTIFRQDQILDSIDFKPYTENTITNKDNLKRELEKTAARGWAIDNEEHELGIRCLAAPVKDFTEKIIAAISISGDRSVVSVEQDDRISALVVDAATEISKRMGYLGLA